MFSNYTLEMYSACYTLQGAYAAPWNTYTPEVFSPLYTFQVYSDYAFLFPVYLQFIGVILGTYKFS